MEVNAYTMYNAYELYLVYVLIILIIQQTMYVDNNIPMVESMYVLSLLITLIITRIYM